MTIQTSLNRFIKDKPISDTTVVVAMSGGVDSSTVAAMLHDEGYKVIGVTLQLYDVGLALEKKGACCAGKDIYDAQKVAETCGFPHYVLDYESLFKNSVIDDFTDSYLRGETPIPCIKCNQSVKFRDLFKVAKDLGADALCTGHYVQRKEGEKGAEMHKAVDHKKDQSYFLFATTQEQLDYLYFPLGGLSKQETRNLAQHYGLEVADKPDSQDICFVPNGDYTKVIERYRPGALDAGNIVHIDGTVLGKHKGIIGFTVGQRKGLGIAWPEPLYVIKINPDTKDVIVGPEESLQVQSFTLKDINWLGHPKEVDAQEGIDISVKLRYAHSGIAATIYPENESSSTLDSRYVRVKLSEPQRAVTPGQACVFYHGNKLLGGGWITRDHLI